MKNYFKILTLFILFISVASCSNDENIHHNHGNNNKQVTITRKKIEELKNDSKFNVAFSKIQFSNKGNTQFSRTVMEDFYNFTIDDYPGKIAQLDSLTSYTFSINHNPNSKYIFENLVVNQYNNGLTKAAIFKYIADSTDVSNDYFSEEHLEKNFVGTIEVTPIVYNDSPVTQRTITVCNTIHTTLCDYEYTHIAGERCRNTYQGSITTCTSYDVPDYYTNPVQIVEDNLNIAGGGSGGGLSGPLQEFINSLNTDELQIFYSDPKIIEYLNNNTYTIPNPDYDPNNPLNGFSPTKEVIDQQALDFVIEAINYLILNPSLKFDDLKIEDPNVEILDIQEYLECFDISQPAKITIYVDQPRPGHTDAVWGAFDVGHTFISIEQGNEIVNYGFYPKGDITAGAIWPVEGVFGNDEGHLYDVSVSLNVNGAVLQNIINLSYVWDNIPYALYIDNCTDFGIEIGNLCGLGLPSCDGNILGAQTSNPGKFGEYLRTMPLPPGVTRETTTNNNAPSNVKTCF